MKKVNHSPSKRYLEAKKQIDPKKTYPLMEAIELVKKTSTVKFDAAVEVHILLNIDTKKGDQQIRSAVVLPHGTGKKIKIAVITGDSNQQKAAKEAGADIVGEKDLIEEIKQNKINFDVLVATPDAMKILAPAAKILGPKGLMPNPKDGTITANISNTITELKKGKINYKNDDTGNIHATIGRISFDSEKLAQNFKTLVDSIVKTKPASVKGNFIKNVSLTSSMGPGIKVAF